jgi:putative restriction endonuclease
MSLEYYLHKLTSLKRANGKAPHKPVLLLALMENIEAGKVRDNRVEIEDDLVTSFLRIWPKLVDEPTFHASFFMPFFHMQSEGFWRLVPMPGNEEAYNEMLRRNDAGSLKQLRNNAAFALIDEELIMLLLQPDKREILRTALLDKYFPTTAVNYRGEGFALPQFIEEVDKSILEEPKARYKRKASTDTDEEELARDTRFNAVVTREYSYTCSITGLSVKAGNKHLLVDACHIIPFKESTPHSYGSINYITNALALTPTLHRAFDAHLIAIRDDYTVMLKKDFTESDALHGIKQFENRQLILPADKRYWPAKENLEWHRKYGS